MIDRPTLLVRYHAQKCAAGKKNIPWHFTFETWLDWWGSDIVNRGRKRGQLVMARNGDIGPYHPDNVRKATCSVNCGEAHLGKKHSKEWCDKVGRARKAAWDKLKEMESI